MDRAAAYAQRAYNLRKQYITLCTDVLLPLCDTIFGEFIFKADYLLTD